MLDLSSQFFLTEAVLGQPTALSCVSQLQELNQYVPVSVHSGPLDEEFLSKFT
ncbi:hypothetical protein SARC_16823, partial [Sphaeroforma arctica JP610]